MYLTSNKARLQKYLIIRYYEKGICWTCEDMGQNGRLVAEYAGSSKLLKRISLIINEMNFGDMLDTSKWLRMRRKCPGRDLLPMTSLPHRHRIAGNAGSPGKPCMRECSGIWDHLQNFSHPEEFEKCSCFSRRPVFSEFSLPREKCTLFFKPL